MIAALMAGEHVVRLDDLTTPVRLSDLPPAGRRICAALIEAERAARTPEPTAEPRARTGARAALNEKVAGSAARPATTRFPDAGPEVTTARAGAGSAVR